MAITTPATPQRGERVERDGRDEVPDFRGVVFFVRALQFANLLVDQQVHMRQSPAYTNAFLCLPEMNMQMRPCFAKRVKNM
eukprot:s2475_g3.t1